MSLQGNLTDFSLAEIFQMLSTSKKTGTLQIVNQEEAEGNVYFNAGEVFFATSNWHRESLGSRLVKSKKITEEQLDKALEVQAKDKSGKRLGKILIELGSITDEVLNTFIQTQIQDTIFDLFRWSEGDFSFLPDQFPTEEDIGIHLSIDNIILEATRKLEQWERIKQKIPALDMVFQMAEAPGEGERDIVLKPLEWKLLRKIDGRRDINELSKILDLTDFETCRIIYGLFSVGLLEKVGEDKGSLKTEG